MSINVNSSAFSDDGKFSTRARKDMGASDLDYHPADTHQLRAQSRGEMGDIMGLSTQVEQSDRGRQRPRNREPIEEEKDESQSPQGTIGDPAEYKSQQFESKDNQRLNRKFKNKSVKGENQQMMIARAGASKFDKPEELSVAACSNFAVIREKIKLSNDSQQIESFKGVYDRLYSEFMEGVLQEFKMMKESYIGEYQNNYQINLNEKQANIDQFIDTIEEKKSQVFNLEKVKEQNMSCLQRFFEMKIRLSYYRTCIKAWRAYVKRRREKKRVAAYSRNTIYRNSMTRLFRRWRQVSHIWGKERVAREKAVYRKNLETEKLTMWTSKVDQLMLYKAQLEDKITKERLAREQLAMTYETALNKGVNSLDNEVGYLSQNPLVHEISLVVAKQLLSKSKEDPDALTQLLMSANQMMNYQQQHFEGEVEQLAE